MRQSGLAPILIVLAIALALGGILIYQKQTKIIPIPTQTAQPSSTPIDETSTWKTVEGNRWSFKYPPEFEAFNKIRDDIQTIDLVGGNEFGIKEEFRLIIEPSRKNIPEPKSNFIQTLNYNGFDWNLYSGWSKCAPKECELNLRTFTATNHNETFSFVILQGRNRSAITSILSTFKFTN